MVFYFNKFLLFFHTLRYLKWRQLYSRAWRAIVKPKVTEKFSGNLPIRSQTWKHAILYDEKLGKNFDATFLNYTKVLNLPTDWNDETPSKLWAYNLHYFEDLLSENASLKKEFHLKLLLRWIDDNPVGFGNAWEPYPTSLRIANVIKAWLAGLELNTKVLNSIFEQASFLSNDLETHLLGNHYFANLKALLFAGVIFNQRRWCRIAEQGLLAEIPEQILQDGANFELTPMYHSLILVDMLDMLNLCRAYPGCVMIKLNALLEKYIPKMLLFMEAMTHPDGGVSFFNDSVNGIAPTKARIESYASKLGFDIKQLDLNRTKIVDNLDSGYLCAITGGSKLIFDAAQVGPNYIPGHAHADTLSFELSIHIQRVFVNSGISEYGLSPQRINQRKTSSHNTVEVDEQDSSQVWSGFRVAKRARIVDKFFKQYHDDRIILQAAHNGYKSLFGGCIHSRKLILGVDSLVVSDSLKGPFQHAKSRFYIHPDLTVSLDNNIFRIDGPEFILQTDLIGKKTSLVDSSWHPEFGVSIPNKVLEIEFEGSRLETIFTWVCQ